MNYKYFPHTEEDIEQMLQKIGIKSLDDLYSEVPECIRFRREYHLPEEKSEIEVRRFFDSGGNSIYRRAFRISYELHSLSSRNITRHLALYLRIPVDDGGTYRHGCVKCFDV